MSKVLVNSQINKTTYYEKGKSHKRPLKQSESIRHRTILQTSWLRSGVKKEI